MPFVIARSEGDEAIQLSVGRLAFPGLLRFARNDVGPNSQRIVRHDRHHLSSATKEVVIGFERRFVMIGERINPTGRKSLGGRDGGGRL